jgi:hypothetical protein
VIHGGEKYLWIEGSFSPFGHCPLSLVIPADSTLPPRAMPAGLVIPPQPGAGCARRRCGRGRNLRRAAW